MILKLKFDVQNIIATDKPLVLKSAILTDLLLLRNDQVILNTYRQFMARLSGLYV